MAELRGNPVIYNAKNLDLKTKDPVVAIVTDALGKNLSKDFSREADFNGFNDDDGDVMSEVVANKKKTVSIRVVPYHASTRAGAVANMYAMLPDPGTLLTIFDSDDDDAGLSPIAAKTVGDDYSVRSAKLGRTSEGIGTVDLELMKFEHIDITSGPIV